METIKILPKIPEIPVILWDELQRLEYMFDFKELSLIGIGNDSRNKIIKNAILLVNKCKYEEAIKIYDKEFNINNPCRVILFNRALAKLKLAYREWMGVEYFEDPKYSNNRFFFHLEHKDYEMLEDILKDYSDACQIQLEEETKGWSELEKRKRMVDEAKAVANKEIEREKKEMKKITIEEYFKRGNLKIDEKDYKGAIKDFSKLIEIESNFYPAYSCRGAAKSFLGDYKGAIEDCSKAIKIFSNDFGAYNNRGIAKDKMGDFTGAMEDYDQAILIDSKYAVLYFNRAIVKYKLEDYEGAIDDCSKFIGLNPKDAGVYNNRAMAKAQLKDYKGAIEDYTKAIEKDPKNPKAYLKRGFAKWWLGKENDAIDDLTQAIELDPNHYIFSRARQKIVDYNSQAYEGKIEENMFDATILVENYHRKLYKQGKIKIKIIPYEATENNGQSPTRTELLKKLIESRRRKDRLRDMFVNQDYEKFNIKPLFVFYPQKFSLGEFNEGKPTNN